MKKDSDRRGRHVFLLERLAALINSETTKETYRMEKKDFTRNRLLTFASVVLMQLNILSKSLSVEVSKFLSLFHFTGQDRDVSKQAFSKARKNIRWEVMQILNDEFVRGYYADCDPHLYKDGLLLFGVDGTTWTLPYEDALVREFGEFNNGTGQPICKALVHKIYDVVNGLTVSVEVGPYSGEVEGKAACEQAMFEKNLARLPQFIDNQRFRIVLLGDRYYPSFYHMVQLPKDGYSYLFRCKADFCKEVADFAASGQEEGRIGIDLSAGSRRWKSSAARLDSHGTVSVRCIRVETGTEGALFLLTDLSQSDLSTEGAGEAFGMRWGTETSFGMDKDKAETENVSSKTPNGARQDVHAKCLTGNIAALLVMDAQEMLDEEQKGKGNKHRYAINRSFALGILKDELPKLLLGFEPANQWYPRMLERVFRRREPVRKGRKYERKRKHKLKYNMTYRRVF